MNAPRATSPFPRSGGAVPNGSPARRQFSPEEAAALLRSTKIEGPPGPSSETVISGPLPAIGSKALHGTHNNSPPSSTTTMSSAGVAFGSGGPAVGNGRAVPARLRATPTELINNLSTANMYSSTTDSSGRRKSGKGSSSPTPAIVGPSTILAANAERLTPFEEEIFAIGRINKVIPEGKGGVAARSGSSLGVGGGAIEEEAALSAMMSRGGRSTPLSFGGGGEASGVSGRGRLTPIPTLKHRSSSPLPSVTVGGSGKPVAISMTGPHSSFASMRGGGVGNNVSGILSSSHASHSVCSAEEANPWASASYAGKRGVQSTAPLRSVQPSPTLTAEDVQNFINNNTDSSKLLTTATTSRVNHSSLSSSTTPNATATALPFEFSLYQSEAPPGEEDDHPNRTATSKPIHVPYSPDLRPPVATGGVGSRGPPRKPLVLQDYIMIAEACQRASRVRIEGAAYYKIGELLSKNKRDTLHKAIPYFKKYLNISRRLQDAQGEGKALNVLGCTYFSLQNHTREMGGQSRESIIATSLEYHEAHAAVADTAGLFIAQMNMGLCYRSLGDPHQASECYKSAMQLAVRSGDRVAEALALANLSEVGATQGDVQTAQVCVERNLEIAASTKDARVGCEAYEQLGTLSMIRGDYASATEAFLMGLEVALGEGDSVKSSELRCKIGLVQGKMRMQEQMAHAVKKMSSAGAGGGQ